MDALERGKSGYFLSRKSDSKTYGLWIPEGLETKNSAACTHECGLENSDFYFSLVPLFSAGWYGALELKQNVFSRTKSRFLGVWEEREVTVSLPFSTRLISAFPFTTWNYTALLPGKAWVNVRGPSKLATQPNPMLEQ